MIVSMCHPASVARLPNLPVIQYNEAMEKKTLAQTNPHLQDLEKARIQRLRSLASSTAIETGESIEQVEAGIIRLRSKRPPAKRT